MYALRGGITWRLLAKDFPPSPTLYLWFASLHDETVLERMNHTLVTADREWMVRKASPSTAIIDSQSIKESGARGYALLAVATIGPDLLDKREWAAHRAPASRPPDGKLREAKHK
ncbi:hypothetical protein JIR23_06430 [Bradyrhizobium diazoefficiens]|nr:hypothetical protein [Bradyrhizobium diazoefficiens]QQN65406.1 hypothetical protein JIR23_06430 [Bradyrhizobium diazoefficiens]